MSDKQAIEAASATYRRCANLLAEASGRTVPDGLGLGPRATFEMTLEICRPVLDGMVRADTAAEEKDEALTTDDFSVNAILRAFRLAARQIQTNPQHLTSRDALIRATNDCLQAEGLKKVRLQTGLGRYAWIEEHIQLALHRMPEVLERVPGRQADIRVVSPKKHSGLRKRRFV